MIDVISEEEVTRILIKCLRKKGWEIISYDFPQGGSGKIIHIDRKKHKTKGGLDKAFIPDIIVGKNNKYLFFENKPYFYLPDFIKVCEIRTTIKYEKSIRKIVGNSNFVKFGIGLYDNPSEIEKALGHIDKVDFIILVRENGNCCVKYQDGSIKHDLLDG